MGFEFVPDLGPRGSAYDGEAIPMEVKVRLGLTGRCLCNEAVGPWEVEDWSLFPGLLYRWL